MPNGNDNKVKVLYDAVSKDYSVGTYDEFSKKLQDPTKRKAFYDGVGKEYQLGSYDEFSNKIGAISDLKKKDGTQPSIQATAQPSKVGWVSSQSGGQQTPPSTSPLKSTYAVDNRAVSESTQAPKGTAQSTQAIDETKQLNKEKDLFKGILFGKKPATDILSEENIVANVKDKSKVKDITDRFYKGELTNEDVEAIGYSPKMGIDLNSFTQQLNTKTKNLSKIAQITQTESLLPALKQLDDVEKQKEHLLNQKKQLQFASLTTIGNPDKQISDIDAQIAQLTDKQKFLNRGLDVVYENKYYKEYQPEILNALKPLITDVQNFYEGKQAHSNQFLNGIGEEQNHIKHVKKDGQDIYQLGEEGQTIVRNAVAKYMSQKNDIVAIAHEHKTGIVNGQDPKNTQYNDESNRVIDYINTVMPVQHAQKKYTESYIKENPQLEPYLKYHDKVKESFTGDDKKAENAYVKTQLDSFIVESNHNFQTSLDTNEDAKAIVSKWKSQEEAKMVTPEIAQKNIERDLLNNKNTAPIIKKRDKDIELAKTKAKNLSKDYVLNVLKKENPNIEIYSDGSIGIKGKTKKQSDDILQNYFNGLNSVSSETLKKVADVQGKKADDVIKLKGVLGASFEQVANTTLFGLTSWIFDKTGIGGDSAKMFNSAISANNIDLSKIAKEHFEFKGLKSLFDWDYMQHAGGGFLPLALGNAAVATATGGVGLPESMAATLGAIGSAGYFTVSNLSNQYGEMINNGVDTQTASTAMQNRAIPDFLFSYAPTYFHTGSLLGNTLKPSILKTGEDYIKGQFGNAFMMLGQGYLSKKADKEAKGYNLEQSFFDYAASDEGLKAISGIYAFAGVDAFRSVMGHWGSMKNWKSLLETSNQEFKDNAFYNNAIQHSYKDNAGTYIDNLILSLKNEDYKIGEPKFDLKRKQELEKGLNYAMGFEKNISNGKLDRSNINDLYTAHNLTLADIHSEYAKQLGGDNGVDNKSLVDYHKSKSKEYQEEAAKSLNNDASFHYLVDGTNQPVIMSDKSFKALTENGDISKWLKDKTIKDVVKNDDANFGTKFREQLAAKEEADKLLAQQKVEKPLTEDELSDLNKRKDDIEMILASDSASKQAGEGGNLVRGGREILSNELKDINEKLDAHKKAQSTDEETVRKAKDYDNRKNMVDAVFAKEDFFTPEEKKTFLTLDEKAQDEMIDAKRKELKEIAQSDRNKDYEQKKADIEKRRQKELDDFHNPFNAQQHIKAYDEKGNLLSDTAESINAKYDAELAELEKSQQIKKVTPTIVVEGKEYYGANHGEAMKAAIADGKILATDKERNPITDIDSPELKDWRKKNGQFKTDSGKLIPRSEAQNKLGFSQSEDIPEGMLHVPEQPPTSEVSVPKEESEKEIVPVSSMIDKRGSYTNNKGETERGMFIQDGERIEFHTDKGNKIYELGSVKEIGNKDISEFNIKSEESKVGIADNGNITVSGKEYVNKYSDPLAAINRDADGNIISVNLETLNGEKRTFGKKDKQLAEDLAYQIHLKEITKDNANREQFEQFINEDGEASKTMEDGGLSETPETPTVKIDGKVSREKIEPIPITVNLKEPIIETVGEQTPLKDTSNIGEQTEIETDESKRNKEAYAKGQKNDEVVEDGGIETPPPPIVPTIGEPILQESGEPTYKGVTMEAQSQIDSIAKKYAERVGVTWEEDLRDGLSRAQSLYPNSDIKEAAKLYTEQKYRDMLEAAGNYVPSSQDIMTFNYHLKNLFDELNSEEPTRLRDDILNDIQKTSDVLSNSKTGRALAAYKAILLEDNNGLQVMRADLESRNFGKPLSDEQKQMTAAFWEEQKEALLKEQELQIQDLREQAQLQLEQVKAEYESKLKKQSKETPTEKKKSEIIKKSADEIAALIRKGINKDAAFSDPLLVGQGMNLVLEGVAKLVEQVGSLAGAIAKYIEDNPKFKGKEKDIEDAIFNHINLQDKKEKAIEGIDKLGEKTITKEMVENKYIKDFVDSFLTNHDISEVIGKATKELQKTLPDVTEDALRKAYLKKEQFEIPTEAKIKADLQQSKADLANLLKVQEKLDKLIETGKLETNPAKKKLINERIDAAREEVEAELLRQGKKRADLSSTEKEALRKVSESQNKHINDVLSFVEKIGKGIEGNKNFQVLKDRINNLRFNYDKTDASEQKKLRQKEIDASVKDIISELDKHWKDYGITKEEKKLINQQMQGISDFTDSLLKNARQDVLVDNEIKSLKTRAKEYERKLNANEFDDEPIQPKRTKTSYELLTAQREFNAAKSNYEAAAKKASEDNLTSLKDKLLSKDWWFSSALRNLRRIYTASVIAFSFNKVLYSGFTRPKFEALKRATLGKAVTAFLSDAMLLKSKEGGYSTSSTAVGQLLPQSLSLSKIKEYGIKTLFRGLNQIEIEQEAKRLTSIYDKSFNDYLEQKQLVEALSENSPNLKSEQSKLAKLEKEFNNNKLKLALNAPLITIGGSSMDLLFDKWINGASNFEASNWKFNRYSYKDVLENASKDKPIKSVADAMGYAISLMTTNAHSAFKSLSGRAFYLAAFSARMEHAIETGQDVFSYDKINEIHLASLQDYQFGMYMQENAINKAAQSALNAIAKDLPLTSSIIKLDQPVTRVPTNQAILLTDYMFGWLKAAAIKKQVFSSAREQARQRIALLGLENNKATLKREIQSEIYKLDPKVAALFVRHLVNGSVGGVGALLALTGVLAYGGSKHLGYQEEDEKKKKMKDVLLTEQTNLFKGALGQHIDLLAHTDEIRTMLTIAAMKNEWAYNKKSGKTTLGNSLYLADKFLTELEQQVPPAKAIGMYELSKSAARAVINTPDKLVEGSVSHKYNKYIKENDKHQTEYRKEIVKKVEKNEIGETEAQLKINQASEKYEKRAKYLKKLGIIDKKYSDEIFDVRFLPKEKQPQALIDINERMKKEKRDLIKKEGIQDLHLPLE